MKLIAAVFFLTISTSLFSQPEQSTALKDYFSKLPDNVQLAVAVIENGVPAFYGFIKESDSIRLIENKDVLFEIGSITKVFTATLLAHCIVNEKIKPQATANQYFRFKFKEKQPITLIELSNHTSGLPRLPANFVTTGFIPDNPYKNYTVSDFQQYLKDGLKLNAKPGTTYDYSNTGAGLLGTIIGISQKATYRELVRELIFDRYEMTATYTSGNSIQNRMVKGMQEDGSEASNWDWDAFAGTGCIISSVTDLSKFAIAQFNPDNKELALTHVPTFTINDRMKIGMGWHIVLSKTGTEYLWHNGGTGGYSSSMALDVQHKNGIILLSNIAPGDGGIDRLCFGLLEELK